MRYEINQENQINQSCKQWFNGEKDYLRSAVGTFENTSTTSGDPNSRSEITVFEETGTTSGPSSRRVILEAVARACIEEIDGVINNLSRKLQQHKVPSSSRVYFAAHFAILAICGIVPSLCWKNMEYISGHNLTRHDDGCAGVTQHVPSITIIRPWLGLVFGLGSLFQWLVVITYCNQHNVSSFEMNLHNFKDNNFTKKIVAIYAYIDALGIQKGNPNGSALVSASSYADLFRLMKNLELCRHAVDAQLRMLDLDQDRVRAIDSHTLTDRLYNKLSCHLLEKKDSNRNNINIDLTHLREKHLKMLAKMIVEGINLDFIKFSCSQPIQQHSYKLKKLICYVTDLMRIRYNDWMKAKATEPHRHSTTDKPKLSQEAKTMDALQLLSTYSCLTLLFASVLSYTIEAWTERHIGGSYQLGACSRGDLTRGNGWCCKFPLNKDGVNLFAWLVYPIVAAACFLYILTINIYNFDMIYSREFFGLDMGFFNHADFRMKALITRIAKRTDISVDHTTLPMVMILKDLVDNIHSVMVTNGTDPRSGDSNDQVFPSDLEDKLEHILGSIGILKRGKSHCCASTSSISLDRISERNVMSLLPAILRTIGFKLSATHTDCGEAQDPLLPQLLLQGRRHSQLGASLFERDASPAGEGGRGSKPRAQNQLLLDKFASVGSR